MSRLEQNEQNKGLIRNLMAASDAGDLEAVLAFYAADYIDRAPSPARAEAARTGLGPMFQIFYDAFPDTRHTIHDLIAEEDRVVARISAEATHTGRLFGIEPTGRRVTLDAIAIYRIENGRIAERWSYSGRGILEQLQD